MNHLLINEWLMRILKKLNHFDHIFLEKKQQNGQNKIWNTQKNTYEIVLARKTEHKHNY